jgi:peptidoglycan/xylan/chitin deacetylase (PgdA/CDA1 family)
MTRENLASMIARTGAWGTIRRAVSWKGVLCLNYHRVGEPCLNGFDEGVWSANASSFDDQLKFLKSNFDVVSPPDLPDIVRRGTGRHVLVTFDDGYLDNYRVAFPILKSHGVAATFFLATGFLDHPRLPWWDEIAWIVRTSRKPGIDARPWLSTPVMFDEPTREMAVQVLLKVYKSMPTASTEPFLEFLAEETGSGRHKDPDAGRTWMTWAMAREMRAAGMVVGGHTINHPVLAQLSLEGQWEEISGCSRRLAEELGEPMLYFSYPVGNRHSFTRDTQACLERMGVQYAFSYYGGRNKFDSWDNLDVRRNAVCNNTHSSNLVRATVTLPGLYARTR